jgi:hypothetical protein
MREALPSILPEDFLLFVFRKIVPYVESDAKNWMLLQAKYRVFALHMYPFARRFTPHE